MVEGLLKEVRERVGSESEFHYVPCFFLSSIRFLREYEADEDDYLGMID